MSEPLSFGHTEVALSAGMTGVGKEIQPETPLRILLLGNWSGRTGAGAPASSPRLADRACVTVDRDNFDEVLSRFGVEIRLPAAEEGLARIPIRLAALDDFHPDRLIERVEMLRVLKELRARLNNPSTFSAAAEELREWVPAKTAAKVTEQGTKQEPPPSIPSDVNHNGEGVPVRRAGCLVGLQRTICGRTYCGSVGSVAGLSISSLFGGKAIDASMREEVRPRPVVYLLVMLPLLFVGGVGLVAGLMVA
jgi:type VI secretion system ImpB/VipA family protein